MLPMHRRFKKKVKGGMMFEDELNPLDLKEEINKIRYIKELKIYITKKIGLIPFEIVIYNNEIVIFYICRGIKLSKYIINKNLKSLEYSDVESAIKEIKLNTIYKI